MRFFRKLINKEADPQLPMDQNDNVETPPRDTFLLKKKMVLVPVKVGRIVAEIVTFGRIRHRVEFKGNILQKTYMPVALDFSDPENVKLYKEDGDSLGIGALTFTLPKEEETIKFFVSASPDEYANKLREMPNSSCASFLTDTFLKCLSKEQLTRQQQEVYPADAKLRHFINELMTDKHGLYYSEKYRTYSQVVQISIIEEDLNYTEKISVPVYYSEKDRSQDT